MLIKRIIICLLLIIISVFLFNCRNKLIKFNNAEMINAYKEKYKSNVAEIYKGDIPFLLLFDGYRFRNDILLRDDIFYDVELDCAFNKNDTKLEVVFFTKEVADDGEVFMRAKGKRIINSSEITAVLDDINFIHESANQVSDKNMLIFDIGK